MVMCPGEMFHPGFLHKGAPCTDMITYLNRIGGS